MTVRLLAIATGIALSLTIGLEVTHRHGAAVAMAMVTIGLFAILMACEVRR